MNKVPKIDVGTPMPDGSIYAGISPSKSHGEKHMYVAPENFGVIKWQEAMDFAAHSHALGHNNWKIGTKQEVSQIAGKDYNKGALSGIFKEKATFWTASKHNNYPNYRIAIRVGDPDFRNLLAFDLTEDEIERADEFSGQCSKDSETTGAENSVFLMRYGSSPEALLRSG